MLSCRNARSLSDRSREDSLPLSLFPCKGAIQTM